MAGRHAEELCPRDHQFVFGVFVPASLIYLKEEFKQKKIEHLEENLRILSEMARTKGGNGEESGQT